MSNAIRRLNIIVDVDNRATGALAAIGSNVDDVGDKAERSASQLQTLKKRFLVLGAAAGTAGLAVGALAKHGAALDKTFARIRVTSQATVEQMNNIRQEVKHIGAEMPIRLNETAKAFKELTYAGFSAREAIASADDAVDLAIAGQMQMDRATKIATQTLNAFRLEADQAATVTNALASVSANSVAELEPMAESLSYTSAAAAAANQSVSETVSAIGVLSDAGLEGSKAGTGFMQMLSKLAKQPLRTRKSLEYLGLSMQDFVNKKGEFKDMTDIIEKLNTRMQNMGVSGQERLTLMMNMFGARGGRAAIPLLDQVTRLQDKIQETSRAQIRAAVDGLSEFSQTELESKSAEIGFKLQKDTDIGEVVSKMRKKMRSGMTKDKAAMKFSDVFNVEMDVAESFVSEIETRKTIRSMLADVETWNDAKLEKKSAQLGVELGRDITPEKLAKRLSKQVEAGVKREEIVANLQTSFDMEKSTAQFITNAAASEDNWQTLTESINNAVTAGEMASAQMSEVSGRVEFLVGSIQSAAYSMYNGFEPALNLILQGLENVMRVITAFPAVLKLFGIMLAASASALTYVALKAGAAAVSLWISSNAMHGQAIAAGELTMSTYAVTSAQGALIGIQNALTMSTSAAIKALWGKVTATMKDTATTLYNTAATKANTAATWLGVGAETAEAGATWRSVAATTAKTGAAWAATAATGALSLASGTLATIQAVLAGEITVTAALMGGAYTIAAYGAAAATWVLNAAVGVLEALLAGPLVLTLGVLVGLFVVWEQNIFGVKDKLDGLLGSVGGVAAAVKGLTNWVTNLGKGLLETGARVADFLWLLSPFGMMATVISAGLESVNENLGIFNETVYESTRSGILGLLGDVAYKVDKAVDATWGLVKNFDELTWQTRLLAGVLSLGLIPVLNFFVDDLPDAYRWVKKFHKGLAEWTDLQVDSFFAGLGDAVDTVIGPIVDLIDWFGDLRGSAMIVFGVLTLGVVPALYVLKRAIEGDIDVIGTLKQNFNDLVGAAEDVWDAFVGVMEGLAGLVDGVMTWYQELNFLGRVVIGVLTFGLLPTLEVAIRVAGRMGEVIDWVIDVADGLWEIIEPLASAIPVATILKGAIGLIGLAVLWTISPVGVLIGLVVALEQKTGLLAGVVDWAASGFKEFFGSIDHWAMKRWGQLTQWVTDKIDGLDRFIGGLHQTAVNTAKGIDKFFQKLQNNPVGLVTDAVEGLIKKLKGLKQWAQNISDFKLDVSSWTKPLERIDDWLDSVIKKWNKFKDMSPVHKDPASTGGDDDDFGRGRERGQAQMEGYEQGVRDEEGRVADATRAEMGRAAAYMPASDAKRGPLSNLTARGKALIDTFTSGVSKRKGTAVGKVARVANAISNAMPALLSGGGGLSQLATAISGRPAPTVERTTQITQQTIQQGLGQKQLTHILGERQRTRAADKRAASRTGTFLPKVGSLRAAFMNMVSSGGAYMGYEPMSVPQAGGKKKEEKPKVEQNVTNNIEVNEAENGGRTAEEVNQALDDNRKRMLDDLSQTLRNGLEDQPSSGGAQ